MQKTENETPKSNGDADAQGAAAQDFAVIVLAELISRVHAHETLLQTALSILLAACAPADRADFLNMMFAGRAEAMEAPHDTDPLGGAALQHRATIHITRIVNEMTARLATSPVGKAKN